MVLVIWIQTLFLTPTVPRYLYWCCSSIYEHCHWFVLANSKVKYHFLCFVDILFKEITLIAQKELISPPFVITSVLLN